jgi:hypothetical protein
MSCDRSTKMQRPLTTVVIGGIISSTLLTLLVLLGLYRMTYHRTDDNLHNTKDGNSKVIELTGACCLVLGIGMAASQYPCGSWRDRFLNV